MDGFLLFRFLSAGARSACRQREFPSTRHRVNSARDLRIAVIEDLRRGAETIGCRQYVVAQLSFGIGARLVELIRSDFEDRFIHRKLLKLLEQSVRNRVILGHEVVIEFDRALNLVRVKTLDTTRSQLQ